MMFLDTTGTIRCQLTIMAPPLAKLHRCQWKRSRQTSRFGWFTWRTGVRCPQLGMAGQTRPQLWTLGSGDVAIFLQKSASSNVNSSVIKMPSSEKPLVDCWNEIQQLRQQNLLHLQQVPPRPQCRTPCTTASSVKRRLWWPLLRRYAAHAQGCRIPRGPSCLGRATQHWWAMNSYDHPMTIHDHTLTWLLTFFLFIFPGMFRFHGSQGPFDLTCARPSRKLLYCDL